MTTHSTSQAPPAQHGGYSLVRVEQLSRAPPANDRSTRYTGPDGLDYRSQAVFDNNYRISLQPLGGAFSSAATGTQACTGSIVCSLAGTPPSLTSRPGHAACSTGG
jgi:hypothetical protein